MKKIRNTLISLLAIAMLITALSGCGNDERDTVSSVRTGSSSISLSGPAKISVIVGGTQNSATILSPDAEAILSQAVRYPGSTITVIVADASPYIAESLTINPLSDSANNAALESAYKSAYNGVVDIIYSSVARVGEVDLMRAINYAAQSDYIILARNGCSTSGILDLRSGIPSDPSGYAHELAQHDAIPDLSGTKVIMTSIAQAYGVQPELSYSQIKLMEQLYVELFSLSGAEITSAQSTAFPTVSVDNLPPCTPIDVIDDHIIYEELTKEGIVYDETNSAIFFRGDSSEFVDPAQAKEDLKELMTHMDPNTVYLIQGSTATGREKYCRELSLKRADAVKNYLVNLGFPADNLITEGLGCTGEDHVDDVDSNGKLIEEKARMNRTIRIKQY